MNSWNDDSGDWQGLNSDAQGPRYLAIRHLIERFCPDGSILDVGCGEAVLWDYLPRHIRYRGIEPSAKAAEIARAKCACDHTTSETFSAGESRWDAIVFNEMLYYSRDPVALLKKYASLLAPDGIFLISIYQKQDSLRARFTRHMTNAKCTRLVLRFMTQENWTIKEDQLVPRPGSSEFWRMWVAKPGPKGVRPK